MPFDVTIYELTQQDRAHIENANSALSHLASARLSRVSENDYTGTASWTLASYCQVSLYRTVHLAAGVCCEWNNRRLLAAIVLLRSVIETVAAFHYALDGGHDDLKRDDLRSFHERVRTAMFGSKDMQATHPSMPSVVNILTPVKRLDKRFDGLRRYYDFLSEMVHPNARGLLTFTEPMSPGSRTLQLCETHLSSRGSATDIVAGLDVFEYARVAYKDAETKHMPLVVQLERAHGGDPAAWPKSGA